MAERAAAGRFATGNGIACREVPVETVREIFERSGISKGELALRMGWVKPDVGRVSRHLGLVSDRSRPGVMQTRQTMSAKRAFEIIEALGVDPVDVDL